MDLAVNGESNVPPGFRFHPTEEELLHYYLRKKVGYEKIDLDVIRDIDINKLEPWDIRERCKIGCTPQNDWYLFSHKDKKYPSGTRTNRATAAGFWKATGRDKVIYSNEKRIGTRKTLVFYRGRAPHGHKSDWIMHEYRLDENNTNDPMTIKACNTVVPEDGWVVCRVFKKKNYNYNNKAIQNPSTLINSKNNNNNNNNDVLDQIIMGRSCNCKQQLNESNFNNNAAFVHLESQSPPSTESLAKNSPFCEQDCGFKAFDDTITAIQPGNAFHYSKIGFIDWVPLEDHLINGETSQQYASSSYCDPYKDLSFSLDQFQFINTRSGTTNQTSQVSSTDTDC